MMQVVKAKNILNVGGKVSISKALKTFSEILYYQGFDAANHFLQELKLQKLSDTDRAKLKVPEKQLTELESKQKILDSYHGLGMVELKHCEFTEQVSINGNVPLNLNQLKDLHIYTCVQEKEIPSTFSQDFSQNIDILRTNGFARPIKNSIGFFVKVVKNARFSAVDCDFYSMSFGYNMHDKHCGSRLAKLTNKMYVFGIKTSIPQAIILPIAHIDRNYCLHLTEMWSALNYIDKFPQDIPIIYTEDTYGLIDLWVDRLKIPHARFKSFAEMKYTSVDTAYYLSSENFLWSSSFFNFFNTMNNYKNKKYKVYFADVKDTKAIRNNSEIISKLRNMGFLIVYGKDLNMRKVIDIFQKAEIVVCPSSNLLTNIAFMKPGTHLVEIFQENRVKSDYYLRARHNNMHYSVLIAERQQLNIQQLESTVAKHIYQTERG